MIQNHPLVLDGISPPGTLKLPGKCQRGGDLEGGDPLNDLDQLLVWEIGGVAEGDDPLLIKGGP